MNSNDDLLDPSVKGNGMNSSQNALPNATAVLVLGILSIVGCFLYGLPGVICGIIAVVLHKKDKRIYDMNPSQYEDSFKNSKAGFICGIIGLSLSVLFFLILLIYIFAIATAFSVFR